MHNPIPFFVISLVFSTILFFVIMHFATPAIVSSAEITGVLPVKPESEAIQEIRRRHRNNSDLLRIGIQGGYHAAKMGISLETELALVDKQGAELLDRLIAEEKAREEKR